MKVQYLGLEEINGPFVYLKTPKDVSFDEQVKLVLANGEVRIGNVIMLNEEVTVIQVYQGTNEMNLKGISSDDSNQIFLSNWFDLQREFGDKLNLSNAISLKNAVMYAGIDFEGTEHDALDDARNTALLLKTIRIPELCEAALKYVLEALNPAPISTSLGSMFDFNELGFIA